MFKLFKPKSSKTEKLMSLGQAGEEFAQKEYEVRGFKIIAANFFNKKGLRLGEIDFIASDKKKIIFVEVKTRKDEGGKFGGGAEAVDHFKQLKILKAVKVFLQKNPKYLELQPQIDVCLVKLQDIDKQPEYVKIISNAVEDWN
jgi:putative endonuclease